ncbi:MAG: hypothetical protein QOF85_424 [Solirubrobacterales bacterium]|jgi:hypothetical protein|nr:hypothetical protein [Solirubrobacterales bacterium]
MADWVTISSLATAGGTLALAGATYASVRSSNRTARLAELALQEQRRPVLMHSNDDDRTQAVSFGGGHQMSLAGGCAAVEVEADAVYMAASLRNVGEGIAVLQGWRSDGAATIEAGPQGRWRESLVKGQPPTPEDFRPLMRDQYVPSGDLGFWQAALRDPADPIYGLIADAVAEERPLSLDLLYTDQVGGQRTISRFALLLSEDGWRAAIARHWYLDADAPR